MSCCEERLAFAIKLAHPTVRRGSLDLIALQGIFVGWNRRMPHGIKIATFRDDGEVEEVFTRTTVQTRGTVFPCSAMPARSQRLKQSSRSSAKV